MRLNVQEGWWLHLVLHSPSPPLPVPGTPQRAATLIGSGPGWRSVESAPGQGLGGLRLGTGDMQGAPEEGRLAEEPS